MSRSFTFRIGTTLFGVLVASMAFSQNTSGRLVEWVQNSSDPDLTVTAAWGKSTIPIVLYSQKALNGLTGAHSRFLLLRQDVVAALASDTFQRSSGYSNAIDPPNLPGEPTQRIRPFLHISETAVYSHPKLQGQGAFAIDCIAFRTLEKPDQVAFVKHVNGTVTARDLRILPSGRLLTTQHVTMLSIHFCDEIYANYERSTK